MVIVLWYVNTFLSLMPCSFNGHGSKIIEIINFFLPLIIVINNQHYNILSLKYLNMNFFKSNDFFNIYKIQFGFSKYILIYFFHIVPKNLKLIKMFKICKIISTLIVQ